MRKIFGFIAIVAAGVAGGWLIHKYVPTDEHSLIGRAKDWVVDCVVGGWNRVTGLFKKAPAAAS